MNESNIYFRSFQEYSTLRQYIKPNFKGFQLEHSYYTDVYEVFPSFISSIKRKIHINLINQVENHQPFNQFQQEINTAIFNNHVYFRFESVITVK